MSDSLYPSSAHGVSDTRKRLAPEVHDAFQTFSRKVFTNGALARKTKQLIAVAVAPTASAVTPKQQCEKA
jgi:alkylhydroperoxidase/carboxymuconolactone decarboxylase family protein YurZ